MVNDSGSFLAETGLGPAEIRTAARDPGFLVGVLDFVAGDQRLIESFAAAAGVDPTTVDAARHALGGGHWERDGA